MGISGLLHAMIFDHLFCWYSINASHIIHIYTPSLAALSLVWLLGGFESYVLLAFETASPYEK